MTSNENASEKKNVVHEFQPNKQKSSKELTEMILKKRCQILEHFTQAYVAETGLGLSDIELVEELRANNKVVWYFQKKQIIEVAPGI